MGLLSDGWRSMARGWMMRVPYAMDQIERAKVQGRNIARHAVYTMCTSDGRLMQEKVTAWLPMSAQTWT